jgi:hypothetical protein
MKTKFALPTFGLALGLAFNQMIAFTDSDYDELAKLPYHVGCFIRK